MNFALSGAAGRDAVATRRYSPQAVTVWQLEITA